MITFIVLPQFWITILKYSKLAEVKHHAGGSEKCDGIIPEELKFKISHSNKIFKNSTKIQWYFLHA
jgi:hypothetical protein